MHQDLPSLQPDDFVSVESFALAWRWTDPRYAVLEAAELASIRPLEPEAAERMMRALEPRTAEHGLAEELYDAVEHTDASSGATAAARWLATRVPATTGDVLVVWWHSGDVAVVAWSLFARRWSDFCYPSSDDVSVLPAAGGWAIRFGHHDELWFGRERGISA